MAILAFVLIAHEKAERVCRTIDALLQVDRECLIAVHYDSNSSSSEFSKIKKRYEGRNNVLFVQNRARCGWGQFGLVEGTVRALQLLKASELSFTHAHLMSCSCWPIRSMAEFRQFLDRHNGVDFIESYDENWMTGGLRGERYTLRHPFSFVRNRWLFEKSVAFQRRLGLRRRIPPGLKPRYGSQWWCLRRETVERVLDWVAENPSSYRFFRHVWIPDETFFQTVIGTFNNVKLSDGYIPTLYKFNAHGKPIVFYEDHLPWLTKQPKFFARKIAESAVHCRAALLERASQPPILGKTVDIPTGMERRPEPLTRKERPYYGRIFEPNSGVRHWNRNLSKMDRGFAVLYGPPVLLKVAGTVLCGRPELTVHGRLFRKDKIEFAGGEPHFFGLNSSDLSIRDYDRALYLTRILKRSSGFPIFQLCPGDDPAFEQAILDMNDVLVVPLVPGIDISWRALFWYLSLPDVPRISIGREADRAERLRLVDELVARQFDRKYTAAVEKRLFAPANRMPTITLDTAPRSIDLAWEQSRLFLHGTKVKPLLEELTAVSVEFAKLDWQDLAPELSLAAEGMGHHG